MALHQTVDRETLAFHNKCAQEAYPGDDPNTALNKYVIENKTPEVFFTNEAGQRCLWGSGEFLSLSALLLQALTFSDIAYTKRCGIGRAHVQCTVGARHFFVRKYKATMKKIDRPKPNAALFAHPSEPGWNVSRNHRRHFFNFPQGKQAVFLINSIEQL
jgi:hypothetical protein